MGSYRSRVIEGLLCAEIESVKNEPPSVTEALPPAGSNHRDPWGQDDDDDDQKSADHRFPPGREPRPSSFIISLQSRQYLLTIQDARDRVRSGRFRSDAEVAAHGWWSLSTAGDFRPPGGHATPGLVFTCRRQSSTGSELVGSSQGPELSGHGPLAGH